MASKLIKTLASVMQTNLSLLGWTVRSSLISSIKNGHATVQIFTVLLLQRLLRVLLNIESSAIANLRLAKDFVFTITINYSHLLCFVSRSKLNKGTGHTLALVGYNNSNTNNLCNTFEENDAVQMEKENTSSSAMKKFPLENTNESGSLNLIKMLLTYLTFWCSRRDWKKKASF